MLAVSACPHGPPPHALPLRTSLVLTQSPRGSCGVDAPAPASQLLCPHHQGRARLPLDSGVGSLSRLLKEDCSITFWKMGITATLTAESTEQVK